MSRGKEIWSTRKNREKEEWNRKKGGEVQRRGRKEKGQKRKEEKNGEDRINQMDAEEKDKKVKGDIGEGGVKKREARRKKLLLPFLLPLSDSGTKKVAIASPLLQIE